MLNSPVLRLPPFRESNEYIGMASVSLNHNTSLTWSLMMGGEMSQGISTSLFWMAHITFVGTGGCVRAHIRTQIAMSAWEEKWRWWEKMKREKKKKMGRNQRVRKFSWIRELFENSSHDAKEKNEAPLWVISFFIVHSFTRLSAWERQLTDFLKIICRLVTSRVLKVKDTCEY